MRMLRRGSKLLRQLRGLAAGPANARPRLLYLPREALELLAAYDDDPVMTPDAMRQIGSGSKAASHLLQWARSFQKVHDLQRYFLDDIGDVLPGWLQKQRGRQKLRRKVLLHLAVKERALNVAEDVSERTKAKGEAYGLSSEVGENLQVDRDKLQAELKTLDVDERRARSLEEEEEKRVAESEAYAVGHAERDLEVSRQDYSEAKERAARGGKAEELQLPKLLTAIAENEVMLREMRTRQTLAMVRAEKNLRKRREWFDHPHEVRFKAAALGEAEALEEIAVAERTAFVAKKGGEHYLKGLRGQEKGELVFLDKRLVAAKERTVECREELDVVDRQVCGWGVYCTATTSTTSYCSVLLLASPARVETL